MHLVEQYALASGSKIGKPQIREKYYPVPADNYLTFSPFSKPSKNYDLWREVLSIIQEPLRKLGINIVQLGEHKDNLFDGCIDLRGKTSIAQCAFLIKRSLLHFGADTFSVHIASAYDKKIVALYSHSPMQNQKSYWNKNSEFVGIESHKDGKQYSFMLEEDPKTINTIEPEKVAMSIFRLLGIDVKIKNRTVFIGPKWNSEFLEVVPSAVAKFSKPAPKDRHIIRMDYHFNEEVMEQQLLSNPGVIVTSKPISIDLLCKNKERIQQVIYLVTDDSYSADFSREMDRSSIPNSIYTNLKGQFLKNLKYKSLNLNKDISMLQDKSIKAVRDYDKLDVDNLMFRTTKFVIEKDKVYPGKAAYFNKVAVDNFVASPIPIIDVPEFWEEMDFFWITEKI